MFFVLDIKRMFKKVKTPSLIRLGVVFRVQTKISTRVVRISVVTGNSDVCQDVVAFL
jgi:hypothetical protein